MYASFMWYHADMIRIGGTEQVEGFRRPDVFQAGIRTENWPDVRGLSIQPQDELVAPGTRIAVGLTVARLNVELDGEVVGYVPHESVRIEGRSPLASAVVSLDLADAEKGTGIGYEVIIEPRKLIVRMAEVAVREFLQGAVPKFATEYKTNVERYLQAESTGLRRIS